MTSAESAAAVLLTVVVVWLHYVNAISAGGLWRDEANTLGVATLPSLGDVWKNLQYESFPILWILVLRGVASLSGYANDPAFRALGFCVGVGILAAIWYYARTTTKSAPLLSLALLAIHPAVIRYGDSMRAYGLGILLILATAALMWRFLREPTSIRFIAAIMAATLSVQTLYYNAVLLAALCAGGLAVCALNRDWRKAVLVVVIGLVAAISIIPYALTLHNAGSWLVLVKIPDYTLGRFFAKLEGTMHLGGIVSSIGWVASFALALLWGLGAVARPSRFNISPAEREAVLFNLVTLLSTVVGIFLFLNYLSFSTEPWYYLSLLAMAGVCIDGLFGALIHHPIARMARLAAVFSLAATTFLPARRAARTLETTVDIIASKLRTTAGNGDLIVVANWYEGVTFARYYRGDAGWLAIPEINVHRVHRYDLVMSQMRAADQTAPVRLAVEGIERALRSGHHVYVVGRLGLPASGHSPSVLPPAPLPGNRWPIGNYEREWSTMVGDFLHRHALTYSEIEVHPPSVYNIHEYVTLSTLSGWRP